MEAFFEVFFMIVSLLWKLSVTLLVSYLTYKDSLRDEKGN